MDKKVAEQWVAALRSGEYKQGTGALRSIDNETGNTEFCCLGVLCNLHAQANPEIARHEHDEDRYLDQSDALPHTVSRWAGFTDNRGLGFAYDASMFRLGNLVVRSLADANDHGANFIDIANWIETNYKRL